MNNNLVLTAQKFCSDYFNDLSLDQHQFLAKVQELVNNFDSTDDKLLILNEIIRIGRMHCAEMQYP